MKKLLLAFILLLSSYPILFSQTMMPLPPHASIYQAIFARGFWFTSPTNFVITGLKVSPDAGAGLQYIHLVRFTGLPVTATTGGSNFVTLAYIANATNNVIQNVSIPVAAGDVIGILGTVGNIQNSYGNTPFTSNVNGFTFSLNRLGYQGSINGGPAPNMWGVTTGQIGRVEIYWKLPSTSPNDAGVEAITEPVSSCVGTSPVKARIKNFGKNKIDSVRVHWSVNAVPQTPFMYRQQLDTLGGLGPNTAIVTLGNVTFVNNVPANIVAWTEKPNNITDTVYSNDTSDVSFIGRAYPTVDLGNDSSFCPGETIQLNAGSGNDSIRWSTMATTQTLNVTAVGTYSVKVYKYGCMGGDTIAVGIFPAAPTFTLGPDTTFCFGQSFLLNGPTGTGLTYLWQDNTTNSTYLVDTSGTYTLTVSTVNNCKKTDSKLVKLHPLPSVTILAKPSNTVCYNSAYFFEAKGITNGSKMYQWKINGQNSGAQTSNNIFTPTTLMYGDSVTVDLITDICAVTPYPVHTNWITMYLKPMPILINGLKADTVMENTSKNYAIGITPGNTYIWRVFGGTIIGDTTISGVQVNWGTKNSNAWISVQETDVTNCVFDNVLPVNVKSIVGIRENIELSVGLAYPNPADQTVNIPVYVTSEVDLRLSLHDITGKKVMEIFNGKVSSDRTFEVPVAELKEGMYFYKISTSKGYETVQKLTVSH